MVEPPRLQAGNRVAKSTRSTSRVFSLRPCAFASRSNRLTQGRKVAKKSKTCSIPLWCFGPVHLSGHPPNPSTSSRGPFGCEMQWPCQACSRTRGPSGGESEEIEHSRDDSAHQASSEEWIGSRSSQDGLFPAGRVFFTRLSLRCRNSSVVTST